MSVFQYNQLANDKEKILEQCHEHGYMAIRGVPGFRETYDRFLKESQKFISLSQEKRATCTPSNSYEFGWSYGIEKFYGIRDSFKGSYYAEYSPDGADMEKNVWPSALLPDFEDAYLALAKLIFETGRDLLPHLTVATPACHGKTRMLYYGEVCKKNNDQNPFWCGVHRDHCLITGLCPAIYKKEGALAIPSEGSGLEIQGKIVEIPEDSIAFQIGEVAQLVTNGRIQATDHAVRKSFGHERFTLAVFINPARDVPLYSNVTDYNDRFENGMTFEEWSQASYRKYHDNNQMNQQKKAS